jgi:hypothetical protein
MTSGLRYQQADRAAQKMTFLEAAGVQGISATLKILDVINTPQQLAFGAAIGLVKGQNIIDAAIEGARQNLSGSDLLEALDVPELGSVNLPIIGKVTGRGVLGLPLDLLIDIPIFGAIGKGARLAKLPVLARIAGEGISKGGRSLRATGLKIPGKEGRVGQEFLDSLLGQYARFQSKNERILFETIITPGARRKAGSIGRKKKAALAFGPEVQAVARRQGRSVDEVSRDILDVIERKTGQQANIRGAGKLDDFKLREDGRLFGSSFDKEGKLIAVKVAPAVTRVMDDLIDGGIILQPNLLRTPLTAPKSRLNKLLEGIDKDGLGQAGTELPEAILNLEAADIAQILDLNTVTIANARAARKELLKRTQQSLAKFPDRITVFRGGGTGRFKKGDLVPVSLSQSTAKGFSKQSGTLESYVIKKADIEADVQAFLGGSFQENEMLIRFENLGDAGEILQTTQRAKQTLFPVANDIAQVKTAKAILKEERNAFLAKSRAARGKEKHPFILNDIKRDGFDNVIISQHGDEVYNLAMKAKQMFDDGVLQEINHGVATLSLDDTWIDYLTHLITPGAKAQLLAHRSGGALDFSNASRLRVYNPNHSFQLLRKWDGMTINELNTLGAKGLLPGFEGLKIEQLLTTDISTILAARLTRGVKAVTDADVFTNAARQLGKHVDDVKDMTGFRKLAITANQDDRLKPLGAYMNNYVFEKDVARHLDSYFSTMQNPRGMHPFLDKFDRLQGLWKASTLFMFPAYHSRNFVGNIWNNHLADATMVLPNRFGTTGYYSAAANYLPARKSVVAMDGITLGGQKYTRRQMDDLLEEHGILNQFREFLAIPEVGIGVKELPGGEFLGRIPGVGQATELGIKTGSWLENNARTAHFFSVLDKSKNKSALGRAREAAASTKKHLFNYDELTDFEQASFRRIFPFFAWTRNNLPLQVRNAVSQPQKFSQLKSIIDFVEDDKPKPRGEDVLIQKWMRKNSPIRTRGDENGDPEYFLLGGWLPAADIGKLAEPWKILADELSPFIKEPGEQLANFDLFLEREIVEFPGQKAKFAGVNLPKRFESVLRNIRLLSFIDSVGASVEGLIRGDAKTGIFSDSTAKPIYKLLLAQTVGMNMRAVDKRAARRGLNAQMSDLKSLLRRELRAQRFDNAERVRDELLDIARKVRQ